MVACKLNHRAHAAALAGMLVAVAACGGSSSTGGSAASSADRDKFVGTWTGNYGCAVSATLADRMIIKAGSGDLDLSITIHVDFANPDTVNGTLTSPTEVNVPSSRWAEGPARPSSPSTAIGWTSAPPDWG